MEPQETESFQTMVDPLYHSAQPDQRTMERGASALWGRVAFHWLLIMALCALAGTVQAEITLDVNNPNIGRLPLAIPDFASGEPGGLNAKVLADVLRNDLYLSGLFDIVPGASPDNTSSLERPDFGRWESDGAQLLILARFEVRGNQLVLEARLYNVATRRMEIGKRYSGSPADHRLMIHRFGERVLEHLTGIPGCFSSRITFVGASGAKELFSMDFDGRNLGQLTRTRSICLSPDWSPDGRTILFTGYLKGKPDLWSLDLAGGAQHLVSGRPGLNASGRYSPRGDRIAVSLTFKGIPKIFIISPQGNIIKRLTSGRGNDISPTWSPDGTMIAYVSDHSGTPQIYSISVQGGPARRLTFETNYNTDPDWSPRGDMLAFTGRDNGRFQVCTIRTDGTDFKVLTNQGSNQEPAWSPDGRMIAFSSNRRGRREIYVMDARGEVQVPVSPIPGKAPAWSPRNVR